jgi:DNA-binding protein YbaB
MTKPMSTPLHTLTVSAVAPGERLAGELRADTAAVTLTFSGNSYYRYTEPELERHLEALARLLTVAWARAYWATISELNGRTITSEPPADSEAEQRFRDLRDTMQVTGRSADGRLTITYTGERKEWHVRIEPGTLAALDDSQFVACAHDATRDLFANHKATLLRLRVECFPPPDRLPRW